MILKMSKVNKLSVMIRNVTCSFNIYYQTCFSHWRPTSLHRSSKIDLPRDKKCLWLKHFQTFQNCLNNNFNKKWQVFDPIMSWGFSVYPIIGFFYKNIKYYSIEIIAFKL